MSDYLAELGGGLPGGQGPRRLRRRRRRPRARSRRSATIGAALDLSDAFEPLATHFDDRPDATLVAAEPVRHRGGQGAQEARPRPPSTRCPTELARPRRRSSPPAPTTSTSRSGSPATTRQDAPGRDRRVRVERPLGDALLRHDVQATPTPDGASRRSAARRTLLDERGVARSGRGAAAHLGGPTAQFADVQDTPRAATSRKVGVDHGPRHPARADAPAPRRRRARSTSWPPCSCPTAPRSGLSAFLFQEVLGQAGISFYLPLIVFVLLVALGSDYNIFLMQPRPRGERAGGRSATGSGSRPGTPAPSSRRPA